MSDDRTRVCMLVASHRADDDRIFFKEARSLADTYDVWVVAPFPESVPKSERVRFQTFDRGAGLLGRLDAIKRLYVAGKHIDAAVYHAHEPESLVAALLLKWRTGRKKVIFDSHELWGGVAAQRLPRPLWGAVTRLYQFLETPLLRRCDALIGATWGITTHLQRIAPRKPIATLLNVPVASVFAPPHDRKRNRAIVFCHDGYLTFPRGLKTIVRAIQRVAERQDVVFKIVGDVFDDERAWLEEFIADHGLEKVILRTGWLPYEEVGAALADCDIGVVALSPGPNHTVAAPNKIFNYLMYGMPFIGPAFMQSVQRLAREDHCCLPADCGSSESLAAAMERLSLDRSQILEMSANASHASESKYLWERVEAELLSLYDTVLGRPGAEET